MGRVALTGCVVATGDVDGVLLDKPDALTVEVALLYLRAAFLHHTLLGLDRVVQLLAYQAVA
ncbi:hypothetical protein ES703_73218 [subsurface metagenome]